MLGVWYLTLTFKHIKLKFIYNFLIGKKHIILFYLWTNKIIERSHYSIQIYPT